MAPENKVSKRVRVLNFVKSKLKKLKSLSPFIKYKIEKIKFFRNELHIYVQKITKKLIDKRLVICTAMMLLIVPVNNTDLWNNSNLSQQRENVQIIHIRGNGPAEINNLKTILLASNNSSKSGSSIIGGVEGFTPSSRPNKIGDKFMGKPRITKNKQSTPFSPSTSSLTNQHLKKYPSPLDAKRYDNSNSCGKINIEHEYDKFKSEMRENNIMFDDWDCDVERFKELSTNPKTGLIDGQSISEAKTGLEGEFKNLYKNLRRPENPDVDLDFQIDHKRWKFLDVKNPIDYDNIPEHLKIRKDGSIKEFPTYKTLGNEIGEKIQKQKNSFSEKMNGPKSPDQVLHIVDLEELNDIDKKRDIMDGILESFKNNNVSADDVIFFNDKD